MPRLSLQNKQIPHRFGELEPLLLVLQITDIHFGTLKEKTEEDQAFAKEISRKLIRDNLLRRYEESAVRPKAIVLLLNGDYIGDRKSEIQEQILSAYKVFIEETDRVLVSLKKENKELQVLRVIVPGNHDVNRRKGVAELLPKNKILYSSEAIGEFYKTVDEINKDRVAENLFFSPRDHVKILSVDDYSFTFWIIDSAFLCGSVKEATKAIPDISEPLLDSSEIDESETHSLERIAYYDPLRITYESFSKARDAVGQGDKRRKHVRIVVMHHSPINPTQRKDKYFFDNDVEFLNFLNEHEFKFLFHGHHHLSTVIHFEYLKKISSRTNPYRVEEEGFVAPHIESGFSAIGSRSLWPDDISHRGINITKFSRIRGSELAKVTVFDHYFQSDSLGGERRNVPGDTSIQFTFTCESLSTKDDTEERMKSLHRLNSKIYSDLPVTEFDNEARLPQTARDNLKAEQINYFNHEQLLAGYTVAVMPPSDWISAGFREAITPYASINLIKASQYSGSLKSQRDLSELELVYEYTLPVFRFSNWLCKAMHRCCEKGESENVSEILQELLKKPYLDECLTVDEREFFSRVSKKASRFMNGQPKFSTSYWALNFRSLRKRLFVEHECSLEALLEQEKIEDISSLKSFLEFPRILLWTKEELLRPSAIEVIRFHEENGIPLFYLNPDALKTRDNPKGRARVGRTGFYFLEDGRIRKRVFSNARNGSCCKVTDFLDEGKASDEDWRMKLWGVSSGHKFKEISPRKIRDDSVLEEFKYLVNHQEIMFASDAWLKAVASEV